MCLIASYGLFELKPGNGSFFISTSIPNDFWDSLAKIWEGEGWNHGEQIHPTVNIFNKF